MRGDGRCDEVCVVCDVWYMAYGTLIWCTCMVNDVCCVLYLEYMHSVGTVYGARCRYGV